MPCACALETALGSAAAAAAIPAGVTYEFDVEGQPLAVLYLEPQAGRVDALAPFVTQACETSGALVGESSLVAALARNL